LRFRLAPFGKVCGVDPLLKSPVRQTGTAIGCPNEASSRAANRLQGSAKPTGFSSYDGSYAVFSCVYVLQFCDAYAFYHKACQYLLNKLTNKGFQLLVWKCAGVGCASKLPTA
jgi:hypothetical protein